jgi:D-galactonate transporter
MLTQAAIGDKAHTSSTFKDAVYRKVSWRLIPLLFICYFFAYLDRVNVGFAKLMMLNDLKFSEAVYGLGAGVFFIGYFLLEVPSNIILHRIGARKWIARILITWGIISAGMAYVSTPVSFYVLRFLLGAAEAGFFPGIILYLTYWYPAARRGRITTIFMAAIPISGLIGSPLSGLILQSFDQVGTLAAWQWMFIIEALPSCLLGVVVLLLLPDRPEKAAWLDKSEQKEIASDLEGDAVHHDAHGAGAAMRDGRVWLLALIYFGIQMGVYGIGFWLPTIVKASGFSSPMAIGLMTAIPYLAATIFMIVMGRSSDATRLRRLHVGGAAVLGILGFVGAATFASQPLVSIACLSAATAGALTALALFWSLPSSFLGGLAAASGLAVINSVGNLAGFLSPYAVGLIKETFGSTSPALYMIAAAITVAVLLLTRVSSATDR